MDSVLHVFVLRYSGVAELPNLNGLIAAAFRKDIGCSASAANPTVRGIGWSKDRARIFAFAQATVDNSCGTQGRFRGGVLNVRTGLLERLYSEPKRRAIFRDLLPPGMR